MSNDALIKNMDNRICYFDNIKFFLILLVVFGHILQWYTKEIKELAQIFNFIYSFHMPLFIFMSGLFYSKHNIVSKITSYMYIYILGNAFLILLNALFKKDVSVNLLSVPNGYWYVFSLIFLVLLTYLFENLNKRIVLTMSIITSLLIGFDNTINGYLSLSRIIVFFPFYYLGHIVDKNRLTELSKNKYIKIISLVVLILTYYCCYFNKFNYFNFISGQILGKYGYGSKIAILKRVLFYITAIIIGFSYMMIMPSNSVPVISKLGKRTINVYFWHFIIIRLLFYLNVNKYAPMYLMLFLSLPITIILSTRVFEYPVKLISYKNLSSLK